MRRGNPIAEGGPLHPSATPGRCMPPVERYGVRHRAVPPALSGLTVLHISDPHVSRPCGAGSPARRLIESPPDNIDLAVYTGDFMGRPGTEDVALGVLGELVSAVRPRLGSFGVFGNHDTAEFARRAEDLEIGWLVNRSVRVATDAGEIRIVGASFPEDVLGALLGDGEDEPALTIGLCHYPTEVFAMSTLGVPLVFAGHTHGGQIRVAKRLAPHTSCDLPPHLATGVLRLRETLCVVSRGLGGHRVPLRINCPPQAPLIELSSGVTIGEGADRLTQAIAW